MSSLSKEIFVDHTRERGPGLTNRYSPKVEDNIIQIDKEKFDFKNDYELKVVIKTRFSCNSAQYEMARENANRQMVHYIYADVYEKTRAIISAIYAGDADQALMDCHAILDSINIK